MNSGRRAFGEVVLLLALAAILFLPGFPLRELWTPDEPRYMEVAREMALTGDYLIPHLGGHAYAEKPPLFFWLTAALYKLGFGLNSGRVVVALASAGTVLLTYFFARRVMPSPGPLLSGVVTLTTILFLLQSKSGVIDPVVTFLAVAALISGYRALQAETRLRTLWWVGFYGLVALGILTKGPAGLFVPVLVLAAYGVVNRRRVRSGVLSHVLGIVVLLGITLAWLVPAASVGGAAYRDRLIGQILSRAVDSESHRQAPYYFVARYPMDFQPWVFVFPVALAGAIWLWRSKRDEKAQFLVLWFGVVFLLFSAVSSKRPGYLMPLVPAVGLLVGQYFARGVREGFPWPRLHRWAVGATFVLCAVAAVAAGALVPAAPALAKSVLKLPGDQVERLSAALSGPVLAANTAFAAALLILSVWGLFCAVKGARPLRAMGVLFGFLVVVSAGYDFLFTPITNTFKSPLPFAEAAKPYLEQANSVYLLPNDMSGVYNLYTGLVRTPVLTEKADVLRAMNGAGKVALVVQDKAAEVIVGGDARQYPVVLRMRVGGRVMRLFVNWDVRSGRLVRPPR